MSKAVIEDIFYDPEWSEETTFPATDRDLLILTEKLSDEEVPTKVFFQAIAIAAYDGAAAFRYADNYLTTVKNKHKRKRKNVLLLRQPLFNFSQN
ncbi:hypothetical protein H6G36_18805 [Anabaena minutissima FACHB-250]|uniref:hypothetical protein n=1 Tax=Anabaena sp. CCY 9402-a TaxID=3103867 RepID=UPI001684729F|nr:hypothetical protein [Anabaena minutissima FACHB-250]